MIESLRRKQVKLQNQREEEILLKIKQKMDRIKANQQKFQPAITVEGHELGSYFTVLKFCFSITFYDQVISGRHDDGLEVLSFCQNFSVFFSLNFRRSAKVFEFYLFSFRSGKRNRREKIPCAIKIFAIFS